MDADVDVIVVVDILSFTTTVDLALMHGVEVLPFGGGDPAEYAAHHGAVVASERGGAGVSLSPASIAESIASGSADGTSRFLIASPNGSGLCFELVDHQATVVAACLRNCTAVAQWVLARQEEKGDRFRVAVIASGEERSDGSIRFAVEDLLGAGAMIDALAAAGIDYCSPEAAVASAAFIALKGATGHLISASTSGQELITRGFRSDIELASEIDVSGAVPVLREVSFRR